MFVGYDYCIRDVRERKRTNKVKGNDDVEVNVKKACKDANNYAQTS